MVEKTDDAWGQPSGQRKSKDLTLSEVKALGRNAGWRSGTGEAYWYFRPEGGDPSGFWFFSIHEQGWRRVVDMRELPDFPWHHDPLCDCGQCAEYQEVEDLAPEQKGELKGE